MKTVNLILVAAAAIGLTLAGAAYAHGPGYGSGPGYGNHMMGQGYGNHMMGQGYGMRGYGHGAKSGCPFGQTAALDKELTVEDVTAMLEHRLSMHDNDRLKIGKVEQKDDATIVAEIVTVDDSLVRRFEIDRKTGRHTPAE